jgi:hypothetical protein
LICFIREKYKNKQMMRKTKGSGKRLEAEQGVALQKEGNV